MPFYFLRNVVLTNTTYFNIYNYKYKYVRKYVFKYVLLRKNCLKNGVFIESF